MQVHGPSSILEDSRKVSVHHTGEFSVLEVGPVRLYLYTPEECDWLIKAAVEAKELLAKDETANALCPAFTGPDAELDVTLYCDREAGHPGSHHAPGPDEGSEVAWSDAPDICESFYLAPGIDYYCTLDAGHAGLHSQLTSAGAFIAEWGYPDGHVHTTSGHKPVAVAP
jgi:hypothetical protein